MKASEPEATASIRSSPGGRFTIVNYSLRMLITWAYDIGDDRLYGETKGLDSVRYDVVAKAPPEQKPAIGRFNLMMQSLLADRFKLRVHRETRQLPMYALLVDKDGPRIHPKDLTGPVGQNPFRMPGSGRWTGTKVSTVMLAKVLSNQLGRSVQDRTGLRGYFDFTLNWTPDEDAALGPSIFTAIREQLGLRLEARKGPAEAIMIDHVDLKPAEN